MNIMNLSGSRQDESDWTIHGHYHAIMFMNRPITFALSFVIQFKRKMKRNVIYFIEDVRAIVLSDFIVIWLVILFIWSSLHHGFYHMCLIICLTFFLVCLSP